MKSRTSHTLAFPQLQRVSLENFSLYSQKRKIELDVADGVVCLAGANGIGKSTFLLAVNFGLTGIVPSASRKFESAAEYVEDGAKFSETFFEGRIDEDDRDEAEIALDFTIDKYEFEIKRGVFEPGTLRALKISLEGKSQLPAGTLSPERKHQVYAEQVAKAVGVKSFEQFVFLQHFVFTFDESRHLLFWDPRALEQALYLAFGADAEVAETASHLRREMEKADSRGRNIQFHAGTVWKRIEVIEEAADVSENDSDKTADLREQHEKLVNARDRAEKDAGKAEAKAADAELALADASAATVSLRKDYETAFGKLTGKRSIVDSHPLVRETVDEERCALCGTKEPTALAHVKDVLKRHRCPFCDSQLQKSGGHAETLAGLKKLDEALEKARTKLESAVTARTRLVNEKEQAQERFAKAESALRAFETKHEKRLAKAGEKFSGTGGLAQSLANLRTEYETLRKKRAEAFAVRDDFKRQLKAMQKKLEASYTAAEEDFVPLFRKLAGLFLGIDLDIRMEGKVTTGGKIATGLTLVLELRNTVRREHHQLSESQRFFVDIALRMAFAQYISGKSAPAGLLIDTPEGSLDIAYESRAGEMFAQFVKAGHRIMMTANINSSQLLLKLAAECGAERMELVRMTSWTELSEVQIKESPLFQDAYGKIEKKLRGANA